MLMRETLRHSAFSETYAVSASGITRRPWSGTSRRPGRETRTESTAQAVCTGTGSEFRKIRRRQKHGSGKLLPTDLLRRLMLYGTCLLMVWTTLIMRMFRFNS